MLKWNVSATAAAYDQERVELLTLLEGSTNRAYVDGVGVPTIGIGFNLRVNLEPVLRAIVGEASWSSELLGRLRTEVNRSYAAGQNATLNANLDRVMKEWHDEVNPKVPASFAFTGSTQIARALDAMDDYYDGRIDAWVAGIPESSERAALFSLCWNAPGLLGPKLKAAIETGNRAEAWYEIRYNSMTSSLPDSVKPGIANRRYVEADHFGLYDSDAKATYAEAVKVGQMVNAHHATILGYEAKYDPLRAASVKGIDTIERISDEIQPAVKAVFRKFGLKGDFTVEELLAASPTSRNVAGDGTGYDSSANDNDLILGGKGANTLSGGAGNDILIGLKGADRLTGGTGNDLFVFTKAKDSKPAKPDVITDFGDADRIAIVFKNKGSFHLLDGEDATFTGAGHEVRWYRDNRDTMVEADLDGDGRADLAIRLEGLHELTQSDFLF